MTDRIDTAVKWQQTANPLPVPDGVGTDARSQQLVASDDAMLALRESTDHEIRMLMRFWAYTTPKLISVGHGGRFAALAAHLMRGASSNGSEEDAKRSRIGSRAWRPRWALPPGGGG
jgi:hypothetical protein